MDFVHSITTVDYHTAGEPTRIVTDGLPPLPGATMAEKRAYFAERLDHVRRFLTQEPRGHSAMHVAVLTTPTHPAADAAALIMNSFGYLNMCGHATVAVATALIERGLVPAVEPVTDLCIETLGGLIPFRVEVSRGRVRDVTFRNLPAIAYQEDVTIQVPELGPLSVDIAYGGLWYVIVEAEALNLSVSSGNIDELLRLGVLIRDALNEQVTVRDPETGERVRVDLTLYVGPATHPDAHGKNVVTMGRHIFDRSPGGTGTSARMVNLWARGKLRLGEEYVHESIIGTLLRGRLVEEIKIGDYTGAIPEISARAFITGLHQFVITEDDPLQEGFSVGGP